MVEKQSPIAENVRETSPDTVVVNSPAIASSVGPQKPMAEETSGDKYNPELPKTESVKATLTPATTTLTTISEASVDSISVPQTARDIPEAEQSTQSLNITKTVSMTNVNSGDSLANENRANASKFQYSLQNDSNASFFKRIESETTKDYQSSGFSFPSVSKISLAEIPHIEKEPEPLNLEQSMRRGKVMSARKTVRFDGEVEQYSVDVPDSEPWNNFWQLILYSG